MEQSEQCFVVASAKSKITEDELKKIRAKIEYNPDTGIFTWKKNINRSARKGQIAGCDMDNGKGKVYKRIKVCGVSFLAHRLAWLLFYSESPRCQVDHIDGNSANNKISNLRDVTPAENNKNIRMAKNNKTGRTGVHLIQNPKDGWFGKYKVTGSINNKTVNLGAYNSFEHACAVRGKWESENGYHENHGKVKGE